MKILAPVLSFSAPPLKTVESLLSQTLKPEIIISAYPSVLRGLPDKIKGVVIKPDLRQCVGKRVTKSLNAVLKNVNLCEYDYILKSDDDIIFPEDFLEKMLCRV